MVFVIVIGLCLAVAFGSFDTVEGWARAALTVVILVFVRKIIDIINPPRRHAQLIAQETVARDQAEKRVSSLAENVKREQD